MAGAKRGTASVLTSTALICAGGGLLLAKKVVMACSRNRLKL